MTAFEQYIQFRALAFKYATGGPTSGVFEKILSEKVESSSEIGGVKLQNVCAKLAQPLVDRLDNALSTLDISKRQFIELALIDALDKVDTILDETNAFEYLEAKDV